MNQITPAEALLGLVATRKIKADVDAVVEIIDKDLATVRTSLVTKRSREALAHARAGVQRLRDELTPLVDDVIAHYEAQAEPKDDVSRG